MKPLTIEELKSLGVGDWVWLEFQHAPNRTLNGYYQLRANAERTKVILCGIERDYLLCDYGNMWLAYKSKEHGEAIKQCVICHKDVSTELPKVDIYGDRYCRDCYEDKCKKTSVNQHCGTERRKQ